MGRSKLQVVPNLIKADSCWQLHSHTFKGLGNREHKESSPYVLEILTLDEHWGAIKTKRWDCSCLNCEISNMHRGPWSAVGNVSGNRCESDCRSRGRKFDPGPVPYFHGDWLWNNFYGHSPPFRWIIQEGLLSVTSVSMCMKYWLTACSS